MKKLTALLLALACVLIPAQTAFAAPDRSASSAKQKKSVPKKESWNALFKDGLFLADGKEVRISDALRKKKFLGIYVSASWCAPCRHFTPRLIDFREEFKDSMEVVLIGLDDNQEKVFKYMNDYKMPWLAVKKDSPAIRNYLSRNRVRGVPSFYLYDARSGKILVDNEIDLRIVRRAITGEKSTSDPGSNEEWQSFFVKGLFSADGKSVPVESLKKKKYIGLYCIDDRSPECAKFTKELIEFYKKNKDKIEIIFYTYGKNKEQLLKYAKDTQMPWIGMEPNGLETQRFIMKYQIKSVPDFRIFNTQGKPVSKNSLRIPDARRVIGGR